MILFEKRFLEEIVSEKKTTTIRKYNYKPWIVHATNLFHEKSRLYIRLDETKIFTNDMITLEMAQKDGFSTISEMKEYILSYAKWKPLYIMNFTLLWK